eukprot:5338104-Alexandrium_andersonii.AAC.1
MWAARRGWCCSRFGSPVQLSCRLVLMAVYPSSACVAVADSVFVAVAPEDLVSRVFFVIPADIGFYLVLECMGRRGWVEMFE